MPIDINMFRTDRGGDPDVIRESQRRRFESPDIVDTVIDLDTQWRDCRSRIDFLNKDKNRFQKEVTKAKKAGGEDPENAAKIIEVVKEVKIAETKLAELGLQVARLLPKIGNIVAKDVPTSDDEEKDSIVTSTFGPNPTGQQYMHHHEVLHRIGGYEPERGVGVAGHRAYFLRDAGLLLNQALINYSIAFLRKRKYSVLQPPFFMTKDVMAGVAQLEQFDEELYKVSGEGTEEKYLIATSEQPLCAFHKGEWLKESELPLRYGGVSTCFRKEAGAHGKDTWGIFRVHQFEKVEQFCICEGDLEKSSAMQDEMSKTAEEFYQSLGISYRVINIVSGELNNAAIKKYDLEAWFPAYEEFRELVSCSNCTDYQSRGMEVRSGQKKMGQGDKKYVHMLNSTLCATTRTMSCILENYQTPTGVTVPEVLVPYMGGITFLDYVKELPKGKREAKGATKGGYAAATTKKPAAAPAATAAAPAPAAAAAAGGVTSANGSGATARGLPEASQAGVGGGGSEADLIGEKIAAKGLEIRELKKSKPDKATMTPHINALLALKAQYKEKAGKDYAPAPAPAAAAAAPAAPAATSKKEAVSGGGAAVEESPAAAETSAKIVAKGEEIRELKKSKADKATLQPHIDALIALKTQYKGEAGKAYVAPGAVAAAGTKAKEPKAAKKAPAVHNAGKKGSAAAGAAAVAKGGAGGGGDASTCARPLHRKYCSSATFKRQASTHNMVRLVPFVMALVTLGVTSGAHVRSFEKVNADNAEQEIHGRRASSYKEPVRYCNFIGCPNGYAPIYDAKNVKCNNNKCEVSQCCDLFCNSIGCPDGYTPIKNANKVECYDEPCEVSQCCEAFCSYHPCPNNFVPVDGAAHIQCPDSGCTDYLCCEDGRHH